MMITDLARGVEADERALAHLAECRECSRRLAEEENLTAGLRAWAAASAGERAPDRVEGKLIEAFRQSRKPATVRGWVPLAAAASIAAALLLFKTFSPVREAPGVAPPPPPPVEASKSVTPPIETAAIAPRRARARAPRRVVRPAQEQPEVNFLPVAQGDGWTPLDGGRLVRVELPRSALRAFGLPMNEERAQEQIQADVMLSNDGLLRAIRFVP
jgi:hypothetical protein